MAPFHFQVEAAMHHACCSLDAVWTGGFAPPALRCAVPFGALQAMMAETEGALMALDPAEVDGWAGPGLDLQIDPRRLAFTSEILILSFSLPNLTRCPT